MKIIEKKLSELTPYANNPRLNDGAVDAVAASIKNFGFKVPIIVDKDGVIVAGHTRLKAAQKLGLKTVPCIVADDLTPEQIKAFRLADNKVGELAGWDFEKLDLELEEIDLDMTQFGFEIDDGEETPSEAVEDEAPEPPAEAVSKLGDVWLLGCHRVMCGDSFNDNDVKQLLQEDHPPLTFTDPPYRLETEGGGILKTARSMKQVKGNGVNEFEPLKLKLYSGTNIYTHNKPLIKEYILLAEREKRPFDLAIYKKRGLPNYAGHLMSDLEYIAIIGDQSPRKGLDFEMYSKLFVGEKDKDNELSYSKPVSLCTKFIELYSQKGDIVLDLFGGSGSTLIACERTGRTCYMMELSPEYVDVIVERWQNLTGKEATLERTGETFDSLKA